MPPRSAAGFVSRSVEGRRGVRFEINEMNIRVSRMDNYFPFREKISKAFFRGSTTGGVYTRENWRTMPRSRVVQVSMDRPDLLDARFSNVAQSDELTKRDMEAAGFLGSYVDQDEQWRYKLIVVPDGNSVPDRLMSQLASNSVS